MSIPATLVLPTDDGGAIELDSALYERLLASGATTYHQGATVVAAARILPILVEGEWITFREIARRVLDDPAAEGSSALRRGLIALVHAGIVLQEGMTTFRRYKLLPGA